MARYRNYKCPDCAGTFKHMLVLSDDPPPDRCPLCGSWVSTDKPPEEVFVPQAPGIRKSAYVKSVDQTYRAMEESSIQRAKDAADMAGVSESEMSHLKITNLRDPSEMREGDIAAIMPPTTAAAQRLSVGPNRPGFQPLAGGGIPNHAPGVGPANAGAAAHTAINGHHGWVDGTPPVVNAAHEARARQMISAGMLHAPYRGK